MSTFVIDASIALKWVIKEEGTPEALALRQRAKLMAPGRRQIAFTYKSSDTASGRASCRNLNSPSSRHLANQVRSAPI